MTYGDDLIKWRFGFIVWFDKAKFPSAINNQYPSGFFGIYGRLAVQYDFTEIE